MMVGQKKRRRSDCHKLTIRVFTAKGVVSNNSSSPERRASTRKWLAAHARTHRGWL